MSLLTAAADAEDGDTIDALRAENKQLRAALEQQDHSEQRIDMVPVGWKLVPDEPTQEMLRAGTDAHYEAEKRIQDQDAWSPGGFAKRVVRAAHVFQAMLAAAPQPPLVEHEPVAEVIESHVRAGLDGRFTAEVASRERLSVGAELFVHPQNLRCKSNQARLATLWGYVKAEPPKVEQEPSPTAGMNIAQRILHIGGRNNAAGYVEFGSIQAVEALVRQVLRDLPQHREPMTDAEIADLLIDLPVLGTGYFLRIARAIEAAHGIGGEA